MRNHYNHEELEASRILDLWRSGADESDGISVDLVCWCMRVLGDGVVV
jgi:hypothetical protein